MIEDYCECVHIIRVPLRAVVQIVLGDASE
jgi:hypothetical protein